MLNLAVQISKLNLWKILSATVASITQNRQFSSFVLWKDMIKLILLEAWPLIWWTQLRVA